MEKFSYLDNDDRTYEHIVLYYKAMEANEPIAKIDMELQAIELQKHIDHCLDKTEAQRIKWCNENAEKFRIYINSLKVFCLIIYMDNKTYDRHNISKRIVGHFIDIWNK
jgi:hypothetical protein